MTGGDLNANRGMSVVSCDIVVSSVPAVPVPAVGVESARNRGYKMRYRESYSENKGTLYLFCCFLTLADEGGDRTGAAGRK